MSIKNKVQLIGNVGQDPKITTFEDGKKVASFSLATNETYKDSNGEKKTRTDWHNLVAWGNITSVIEKYVAKGKEIAVEGKLRTRSYTTEDGAKKTVIEVQVYELLLLGNKSKEEEDVN